MAAVGVGVLDVALFGSLRLRYAGEPFALAAPPKVAPLLAALVLGRGDALSRERLAFMLWPDDAAASARANLRRHLHYLARALPDAGVPWLLADARTVRWNPALAIDVDVARFAALLAIGRRAEAAEAYAGDLLPDLDEEWLATERARLRAEHLANLAALIDEEAAARRHASVEAYARRMLEADPWREDALRALMSARFELGDRAGALAAYETFEQLLADELGSDPMPETRALRERIAAEDVAFPPAAARRATPFAPLAPFVGRDEELARLRGVYRSAAYAHGGLAFVVGEAGIGKSRLLAAFRACVEREGATFAAGGTSTLESGPYEAVLEALRALAPAIAAADLDEVWLRTIAGAVPAVAALRPGLEPPAELEPARLRDRLFEAIARALRAVAARAPLVVALEDLHWAGPSTCALVASLAGRLADDPILLVATYRDEELGPQHPVRELRRALARAPEHLALRPFGREEVARFVAEAVGVANVADESAARFHEQSDGNPLALGELLRDGLESGTIRIEDGKIVAERLGLPRLVEQVLAGRVERLGPQARAVADLAAVIGRRFSLELLARAAGLGESRTAAALDELLDRQLAHDLGKGEFAFLHHTIADAIYARSEPADRRRRHQRVAEALEALHGDRDELARELAHHWDAAGDRSRAARWHLRAAARALGLFANDEARERLARVLEHAGEARNVAEALLLHEELERRAGDRAAQERDLAALEGSPALAEDPELRCKLLRRRAALAQLRGDRLAEDAALRALGALAEALGSARWRAVALLAEAVAHIDGGLLDDASRALLAARELAADADPSLAADIGCRLADVAVHRGAYDEAEAILDDAWRLAANDEAVRYRALEQRYAIARGRDRVDRVHALARELLAYARRIGDRRAEMFNHLRLANAALFLFGIAEAREHYAIAERMAETLGSPRDRTNIAISRGIFAYALGAAEDGRRDFERARDIAEHEENRFGVLLAEVNLAGAEYASGAYEAAAARARAASGVARALGAAEIEAAAACTGGAALRRLGRSREAVEALASGVAMERAAGLRAVIGQDLAELTLAQLDAGDVVSAAAAIDELQELAETSHGGLTQPQFMLRAAAEAARAAGDTARAGELLVRAAAAARARLARIPDAASRETFARAWFNEGLPLDAF